ncbi:hypothetical protein GOV13_02375 [Candidatus Pacearchaeota archaeon]|nr:hypothetical protein [Candidatus Pacearchaeota archaeon]
MAVKIFGAIDIFVGLIFWIYSMLNSIGWNIIPDGLIIVLGIILLIKGLIFAIGLDFFSVLDVITAIIILISISFTLPTTAVHVIGIYLVGKGIVSLAG